MEREENKGSLVPHPMRERSAAYRYRYCFGLGVLAMGNMRAIMELQPYYERLLRQLLPDQDQYAQIITDINNDLERHLELVRQTVCGPCRPVLLLVGYIQDVSYGGLVCGLLSGNF